jgi:molybdopterin molybdotransferase
VLADHVTSRVTVPAFANSAMDGYAVQADDIAAATVESPVSLPVTGEVLAGGDGTASVSPGTAVRIMTGAPVPDGADAVVPVETTSTAEGQVAFHRAYERGANIRQPGEDLTPGQPLVAAGRRVTPADLGLLAAAGVTRVPCVPQPRVVVLISGDELVRAEEEPGPGHIRDANGPMLAALIKQTGACRTRPGSCRTTARR